MLQNFFSLVFPAVRKVRKELVKACHEPSTCIHNLMLSRYDVGGEGINIA